MSEPTTTLDDRKSAILRAIVREYIETALPVGSGHISRSADVAVSSATVRNDMVALEHEGYLTQPHTSAGRIPTDKGYRYFVDHLDRARGSLDGSKSEQVRGFFDHAHGEIERMLSDTSRLLSELTDYAGVVVRPQVDKARIRSIQLVGLTPTLALVVIVMSNGAVDKRTIELTDEITPEQLVAASACLTEAAMDCQLSEIRMPADAGDRAVNDLCTLALGLLGDEPAGDHLFVGGAARMTESFEAVETVRAVLSVLEEQLVVVTLIRDVLGRGRRISIGSEAGVEPLSECSLVVAPYYVDGEPSGSIGVLGPTRMNYPEALAAVAVVSQRLGHRLSEG